MGVVVFLVFIVGFGNIDREESCGVKWKVGSVLEGGEGFCCLFCS